MPPVLNAIKRHPLIYCEQIERNDNKSTLTILYGYLKQLQQVVSNELHIQHYTSLCFQIICCVYVVPECLLKRAMNVGIMLRIKQSGLCRETRFNFTQLILLLNCMITRGVIYKLFTLQNKKILSKYKQQNFLEFRLHDEKSSRTVTSIYCSKQYNIINLDVYNYCCNDKTLNYEALETSFHC